MSIDSRHRLALAAVGVVMLILVGGLIKLQVVHHAELAEQSENNRLRVEPIIPRRGIVYDRFGEIIIDNRLSFTATIVMSDMHKDSTIPNLADLIGLDSSDVRKRLSRNLVSRYQPAPIKRDLDSSCVAILEEQGWRFPGVSIQMENVRRYRDSLGAECFTGYVGEVSASERKRRDSNAYRLGSMIGKKGIERQYDSLVRGREGTAYIEFTATGRRLGPLKGKEAIPAVPGADLILTVDNRLQRACVAALDTFCCGAVVAIDPRNGDILAMTSYPGFDPNIFSSVIPDWLWANITADSTHPLLNRPLDGQYPPGSTTKLVTIGAALEMQLIRESTQLKPCYGGYQFGNRYWECWKPAGHGFVDAVGAIEQSCDVYLYQVGLKLGIDALSEYYGGCGFGKPVGIDLPSESPGLNPNSAWYDGYYGKRKWSRGLVLNNAIGQGEVLSTPLQLAQFFCGLAHPEGAVYRPHLVARIQHPDGREEIVRPELSFRLPFSAATLATLRAGYSQVVEGDHGTARRLRNSDYRIGGKTGTAENSGENHSWFVGVAPLEAPEIVVVAIIENAGHGSDVAAPLVGQIIRTYMEGRDRGENMVVAESTREQ
jgi:penicillin-binding protein 2